MCWESESSIFERSALPPLQCTHHTKQEHSSDYLFSDLRAISFFLFLLLFNFSMTTQWEGPRHKDKDHHDNDVSTTPHHTQPPNPRRRATHDVTRHHAKKNKDIHASTCICTCVCMRMCICFSRKKVWNTYLPWCVLFQAFDVQQWLNVPFLWTKFGRDKPHAQNCIIKKNNSPWSKTATVRTADKIIRPAPETVTDNDNDNDNDTLREVPHQSNEGLALQARVSGL